MMSYISSCPDLEAPEHHGSRLFGVFGALLGALIGAIPWFLASTFAGFFVGWLGFLVGYAACLGYRKLGGLRSTKFAMTVVILSSLLALAAADFASNLFVLCTDSDWQRSAARYGIPVARLAFDSLMMPENWHLILPNLLIGMLIGVLGVFSARTHVLKYTDPEKAARLETGRVGFLNTEPASTGLPLPDLFTVRPPKSSQISGLVLCILFLCFIIFSLIVFMACDMPAMVFVMLLIYGALSGLSLNMFLSGRNLRLEINGEQLCSYTVTGKPNPFRASDIAGVSIASLNGYSKLYGADGKVLFKFQRSMRNYPLLMQYLTEHHVPLRG